MTSKEYTSKEYLELLYSDALNFNEFEEDIEEVKREYNIIKQELERLEIIEENYHSLNKEFEDIEFENYHLRKENIKLKQAIEILKRYVAISKRRNEVNGNYDISCIYSFGSYKDIIQKEYELLKEVLGNE